MDAGVWVSVIFGALAMAGTGLGAYVAIRVDLARMHERVNASQAAAKEAHARIDKLVSSRGFDRRANAD